MRLQHIETTQNGAQKALRYKWQIVDEPGRMMLIDKGRLVVDESYQRDLKQAKVLALVREWSHFACGSILVANRGGMFYVVDGQHRVAAAKQHPDITQLPCLVFQTFDAKTEARAFKGANILRRPLRSVERFKASIVEGEAAAIWIDNLITGNGRVISEDTTPRGIRCLTALYRMYAEDADVLQTIFPLASSVCEGRVLDKTIIEGLFYIERRMPEGSLTDRKWSKRLGSIGYENLKDAIARASAFKGKQTSKAFALGVLNALNHGLQNRLVISTLNPEDGRE